VFLKERSWKKQCLCSGNKPLVWSSKTQHLTFCRPPIGWFFGLKIGKQSNRFWFHPQTLKANSCSWSINPPNTTWICHKHPTWPGEKPGWGRRRQLFDRWLWGRC
jgi:hypothetical protein